MDQAAYCFLLLLLLLVAATSLSWQAGQAAPAGRSGAGCCSSSSAGLSDDEIDQRPSISDSRLNSLLSFPLQVQLADPNWSRASGQVSWALIAEAAARFVYNRVGGQCGLNKFAEVMGAELMVPCDLLVESHDRWYRSRQSSQHVSGSDADWLNVYFLCNALGGLADSNNQAIVSSAYEAFKVVAS